MTLVLGFNFGDAVVLTADSRLTIVNRMTGDRTYDDDTEKVMMTGLGPIAAAGDANVIWNVTSAIDRQRPVDSDQMRSIFEQEMDSHPRPQDPIVRSTSWLFAFHTGQGNAAQVGLASHLAQNKLALARVPVSAHEMIPAFGMPDELIDRLNEIITRAMPRMTAFGSTQEKIQGAMMITEQVLTLASRVTDAVSTRFQIGLRTIDSAGVSGFVEHYTDPVVWQPTPYEPNA